MRGSDFLIFLVQCERAANMQQIEGGVSRADARREVKLRTVAALTPGTVAQVRAVGIGPAERERDLRRDEQDRGHGKKGFRMRPRPNRSAPNPGKSAPPHAAAPGRDGLSSIRHQPARGPRVRPSLIGPKGVPTKSATKNV